MDYYVCPKCGSPTFIGHQLVRMDILVEFAGTGGLPTFAGNCYENVEEAIYDSEVPYGPFTCRRCGAEFENAEELRRKRL